MNQIQQRVSSFIKGFPPFDLLPSEALSAVAQSADVYYCQNGDVLFREGQSPLPYFFVTRKGSVRIASKDLLIDMCDEGDVFGVRALLANDTYLADAIAEENTILYKIPLNTFKKILAEYPAVANYFASGFASGKSLPQTPFRMLSAAPATTNFMSGMQVIEGRREVLACVADTTIKSAATMMSERGVGSIVVLNAQGFPIGIITDKDFRKKIATGINDIHQSVSAIMSSPVICVAGGGTQTDYLIDMLTKRVHHLCVTENGTQESKVVGMITEHDLLLLQGTNPAVILREMDRENDYSRLKELRRNASSLFRQHINQNLPVSATCRIATAINDRLMGRVIEKVVKELGAPPCPFAWLALGSLGREEQILLTDQDHALVFSQGDHQAYFLQLATMVSDQLESMGFPRDPADVSAENPKWCLSLEQWKSQFSKWMTTPEPSAILHCNIFFDFRKVYGDSFLTDSLREHIFHTQSDKALFTALLAKEAVETPAPLSFFRNLVVERTGENKDQFDLKLRVLLPLVDCARVLAITQGVAATQTIKRYEMLKQHFPERKSLFDSAMEATAYAIGLKAKSGFTNSDNGRFIAPEALSKLDRQMLRNIFETISELQQMLKLSFQTDTLR